MKTLIDLSGRTIIVTGAAQGIGRGLTDLAVELGANVVAVDLNGEGLSTLAASLPAGRVLTVEGDVSDGGLASVTVARAVAQFGAVDGLVNNAGMTRPAMIEKMTHAQWHAVLDVHLSGSFYWLQAVGAHIIERGKANPEVPARGSIVNISSVAGQRGAIGQINYAAAKAGLLGMTMTAAREWSRYGIRTNSVCFGVVETPMTEVIRGERFRDGVLAQIPMQRWSSIEEVVQSVCFLLSDAASYITGQHLGVNGGFHISV